MVDQITKDWKNLSGFILASFENGTDMSDEDMAKIDLLGKEIMDKTSTDLVQAKVKKIMSMNIFRSHFEIFERLPRIWGEVYKTSLSIVAAEYGAIDKGDGEN